MEEKGRLDEITRRIIGAAIEVHGHLGPGLLESAYESCLAFELRQMGFRIEQQKPLPVTYRDVKLDCGYRLDLVVEDCVVVEIKAIDQLAPIHVAQLLSYLRLSGRRVGLLINFHVRMLKNGVKRIVNDFPDSGYSTNGLHKNHLPSRSPSPARKNRNDLFVFFSAFSAISAVKRTHPEL